MLKRFIPQSRFFLALLAGILTPLATPLGVTSARADNVAAAQGTADGEIGVINLSDQDVTPQLRDCLKHKLLGECLKQELNSPQLKQQNPPQNIGGEIDDEMDNVWSNFLFSALTPNSAMFSTHGIGYYFGVQIGGDRLDMDEIAMDPNKLATEQKLGGHDVWVRHDFEILPQVGSGWGPSRSGYTGPATDQYVEGLFTFNNLMRITKCHPMDQVYNDGFWGYSRQDSKLIEQDFPMYLGISGSLNGHGLLPGEGVEFERYGAIGLGIGPTLSLIATPVSYKTLAAGVFGSAGLVINLVRGHFRTVMEVQSDGLLHLALERIKQDSEELQAQLDAGLSFPIIGGYVMDLIKVEMSTTHTAETILDMTIDPAYPQAIKALYHAYLGYFGSAQALAAQADTNYQGVRLNDHATMYETMHDRDFSTPFYSRGSSIAEDTVNSTAVLPSPAPSLGPATSNMSTEITIDSMDQHRKTLRSDKDLQIYIDTDDKNPDPATNRSLSVKFKFKSDNARPDELREFLDFARLLAPAEKQGEISDWLNTLESDHPTQKRGKLQGYFYVNFDPDTLASLLEAPEGKNDSNLIENWAAALGLPDPQSWGTMSEQEQNSAAKHVPGLKKHLKVFRRFCKAISKALEQKTAIDQAKAFVTALRGKSYDVYPIVALAVPADHTHMLALERITLGDGAQAKSLAFSSIGLNYIFPKKTLY